MKNGWTGGQYSLFRAAFGIYLFAHFAQLTPWAAEVFSNQGVLADGAASPLLKLFPNVLALWDGPAFVTALVATAAGLSLLFAAGFRDRLVAVLLWYVWACLHGRMPLISNPGLPYVGWLLLAHAFLPPAPFGSWSARGRVDPDNGWRMPDGIILVAWVLMALGYSYSGYTKLVSPSWLDGTALARVLDNPLARPGWPREAMLALPDAVLRLLTWGALAAELLFAPLALLQRVRPWIWMAMLAMHLGLIAVIDFADLSLGMVMLHLFTFDPAWVTPRRAATTETLFYDGRCGLCHRAVRFVLAEDRGGEAFRVAPLGGETFQKTVPESRREGLPDSVVVQAADGTLLTRSAAVLHILHRLGGAWRVLAVVGSLVPAFLRDGAYNGLARVRRRIFAAPAETCPLLPKQLRDRFAA
jgi:predicted DCC family thiol-disulfide oxidoreductase YuxK